MGLHQGGRCEYCDGTGDVHSLDGEWRGECTECEAALAARLPVRPWEFDPGSEPERCTCAGADSLCEACLAMRDLFEQWATEQRFLDAISWQAYSKAWPEAICGGGPVIRYEPNAPLDWSDSGDAATGAGDK
jgi:hypothetical protein